MAKKFEIYKCELCGNVVEVIEGGDGTLVCCGKEMVLFEAQESESEGKEKHVPVVSIEEGKVIVNVGSVDHPMEEKHFIELIEILQDGKVISSKHLYAGDKPKAIFSVENTDNISARSYCNIHGLWKS